MSGIYALIDLRGAPIDPRTLAILGLSALTGTSSAAQAIDSISPADAHILAEHGRTTAFLGRLDESEDMADRLGIARSTPEPLLARAALDRFGAETPGVLLGDWIMLDHGPTGQLALLASIGGRTPLLYARVGDRVAIAPSIHTLSRLNWVGRALNEDAFLASLTGTSRDYEHGQQTILRAVRRVPRASCIILPRTGEPRLQVADPFIAVPRWSGSRSDAMAEAEALLRRIVRQRLARSPAPGLLLSGGLDSSLLAWALSAEGASALPALSSAVAPGRGVADETPFAAIVANTLGHQLHPVVPRADVNVYRPSDETLASNNSPPLSPREYLYEAFAEAAAALGVTELFDGAHGELTFTAPIGVRFWRDWPRVIMRGARDTLRNRLRAQCDPLDVMSSVALAPHYNERSASALRGEAAAQSNERWWRNAGEPWGYSAGARAPLRRDFPELRVGRLRRTCPFHDIRLLRLFAGFPSAYMVGEGMTRWPARTVLAGRLPNSIVRRGKGMPFSPDYHLRLVEQAPVAMGRIATFRASGCDEWFDLEWLHEGLGRIVADQSPDVHDRFRVQLTAQACEFLTWWRAT